MPNENAKFLSSMMDAYVCLTTTQTYKNHKYIYTRMNKSFTLLDSVCLVLIFC